MVRYDVEDLSHSIVFHPLSQYMVLLLCPDFGVQHVWVDDVVSVDASPPCLEIRGGIDIGDTEFTEIRDYLRGVNKPEKVVELYPVCRNGYLLKGEGFLHHHSPTRFDCKIEEILQKSISSTRLNASIHSMAELSPAFAPRLNFRYLVLDTMKLVFYIYQRFVSRPTDRNIPLMVMIFEAGNPMAMSGIR